ncbi:hypothetical protein SFUMM280S_03253 [Streptomyces fumanus]
MRGSLRCSGGSIPTKLPWVKVSKSSWVGAIGVMSEEYVAGSDRIAATPWWSTTCQLPPFLVVRHGPRVA